MERRSSWTRAVLAAVLAVAAPLVGAQPAAAPVGRWDGAISLPGQELRVVVDLSSADGGALAGVIDIPAQGATDLPLVEVQAKDGAVSFAIQGVPGSPRFKGALSSDGTVLSGDFTQGGQTFPFRLERKGDPAREAAPALAGIGDFIQQAMKDWKVPGFAVAVVKDDAVVFAEGYGLRDVEKSLPATRDTLFAIGSSTKAFTAASLAVLVEDGKLAWDAPVRTYLPTFALKDDVAREHMTPRDLVTHRSGLPRHDFVWYNAPLTRKEMVERLGHLEPNAGVREKFQYQNLMFMTAGYLAGQVAGTTWEDLVRARVFRPLGMTSSNFSVRDSEKTADYALPYQEKDKVARRIPFRDITEVGPAGSINSSATEMARWLRLQLGKGKVGEARLLSASTIAEMHSPQTVLPVGLSVSGPDPEVTNASYGLGWFVESYRGKLRVHHGGAIDGFRCQVAFVPDSGVGVVTLANLGGTLLTEVVANTVIDRLLGLPPVDWNTRWLKRRETARAAADKAKQKAELDRKPGTRPAHPLGDYAAEYEHPAYGTVAVVQDGQGLKATLHAIPMRLEHWHYETFRTRPEDPALAEQKLFALFMTNAKGDVDRLSLPLEPQASEIVFVRKPPARLSDPAVLKGFEGAFVSVDDPSLTVDFKLKGGRLAAVMAGRELKLAPYLGTEFKLEGLTGYSVRFLEDATGTVGEAALIQPNGVYSLKRKTAAP
jgi:CubicO group peptidase (beta-lactamase class C family)